MCLNNLSGPEMIALSSSISFYLASQLSTIEIANLTVFLSSLASNLAVLTASKAESSGTTPLIT